MPVIASTSPLTSAMTLLAIAVYVDTHASTCHSGAPYAARDDGYPAVSCRSTNDAVLAEERFYHVLVEAIAQHRPRHTRGPEVLLGDVVVARESEGRVGRGRRERCVDDVVDPGFGGGIDERAVLVEPIGALGGRHHEQGLHPVEGADGRLAVGIREQLDGGATATAHPRWVAPMNADAPGRVFARARSKLR